jgi:hypothetical protein
MTLMLLLAAAFAVLVVAAMRLSCTSRLYDDTFIDVDPTPKGHHRHV